jgi:hypothetical protein
MSLTSHLKLTITAQQTAPVDLGAAGQTISDGLDLTLASGTGANQADRIFSDRRSLAASTPENLDLAAVLTDPFGVAITFATIKAIVIKAAGGNTNDVVVTRPASLGVPLFVAAGDGIAVKPGGAFVWVAPGAGVTVTPDTGDLLTVTNGGAGTPVTYDVIVIGTSA